MRQLDNHPVKEFCEDFRPTDSTFRLDQQFSEEEVVEHVRGGRLTGLIQADIVIPQHRRLE